MGNKPVPNKKRGSALTNKLRFITRKPFFVSNDGYDDPTSTPFITNKINKTANVDKIIKLK